MPENLTIKPNPAPQPGSDKVKVDLVTSDVVVNADGVSLVPFRKVAEALGYTVKWNQETYAAELTKGAQWTSVSVGKDSYFFAKMAPVALGAAPVILNDSLYVPVKFVSDILKADVTTGSTGLHIEQ
ncbi:Protease inhibitor precursor [compost metagenome]